ncbi:hypothetical protein BC830DRAFT_1095087 [Chytriomyces sp. MP71]|nr:hypothetical protein BC830DRAFT_1095087 [Chytriomyces sp. MP71]
MDICSLYVSECEERLRVLYRGASLSFSQIIAIQILARIVPALTGSSGGKVEASHILVKDQAKAEELREQLLKDPSQFGAIAKQHSTCPSGKNGGSLGSFGKGQMVAEFDKYCFDRETKVNGISPLVKTQFGYHIIMVTKVPEAK